MKTIAVIEDDLLFRENIVERLQEGGYNVIAAENGLEGIELIRQHMPDLVLCDIMMPKLGGFGVLEYIRKDPETELIPFIFLSALDDRTDQRKGMLSGADDYLTKPFTRTELFNAIEVRLQKNRSFEQHVQHAVDEARDSLHRALPHEIFTPLNAVLGLSQLLFTRLDDVPRADMLEMLQAIHQAGLRLQRLVTNHLRYTELENMLRDEQRKKRMNEGRCVEPDTVIAEIAGVAARRARREKDLRIDLLRAPIAMDASSLEKIVEELTDNACKFSLDGARIEIRSEVQKDLFVFSVTDHGRGMTPAQIEQVGAYRQFDRAVFEQRGVGLGLAIVAAIVELHGGAWTVESVPGSSTRVTVSLPCASVADA